MSGLTLLLGLIVLFCTGIRAVSASDYPSRSVRMIVPASAGSSADLAARVLGKKLSAILGRPFVIENKVGAGGRIGASEAARAAADGYTLLYGTSITHALYPALVKPLAYDPLKDFIPLGQTFWFATILSCNAQMPFDDMKSLISYAKENPEKLSFANSGIGGGNHFSNELFAKAADIKVQHIPFRGNAPGVQAVVGGFVNCTSQTEIKSFVDAGQLRAFATTGKDRDPRFPNLPTMSELGLSGAETTWWHALYAPAGTPDSIVRQLQNAVKAFAEDESIDGQTHEIGLFLQYGTSEQVISRTKNDIEFFSRRAREDDIRLE